MNAVKDRLKAGRTLIGTGGSTNPDVIATIADSDYDFILFDCQHSPVEVKEYRASIAAMRGKKAAPFVRVSDNRADTICFALDIGARGIVVPMVNTAEEAAAMVRSCRYYPKGNRSNAGVRGEWGDYANYRDYLDAVNDGLMIIPMVETNQAIANIDAIAAVEGVDVILVGPSDLSIELGVALDYPSDTYQKGLDKIAAAAKKAGIAAGMYFIPPGMDPNFYVKKGFKFFTIPWGPYANEGIKAGLSKIKR